MAQKRMLADVLWEAANVHLHPGRGYHPAREPYSCTAVSTAMGQYVISGNVRSFLQSLGCETTSARLLHAPWMFTKESQGVRYMWLLLAMHVAEDERIEV